ncbi:MAG: mechanosensitive ion channel domain-containing protein [Candidatus Electrothrix sp. GW3-4]|uniref:mechanosensitive ion channel family protein n=1 Tax=Candidatus Electrothrix sp. GW3-4 TaxID=3126740 RepID=UPI0030CD74A3
MWQQFINFMEESMGIPASLHERVFSTIIIVFLYVLIRKVGSAIIGRRTEDASREYILSKSLACFSGGLVVIILIRVWLGGIKGMMAYFGILSAGLAIALQDLLTNLAGWIFISSRKPFTLGDRIQIGDHAGDVIDLRLFQFSLIEIGKWVKADQSTGRIINIPNGLVFKESVINYTQGFSFIWHEISVTVTFESNWEKAKSMLTEIANRHTAIKSEQAAQEVRRTARNYLIHYQHLTPIVWTSVTDFGVTLTIRYLSDPRKRRSSEQVIWEDILRAFAQHKDIDFSYPTMRYYDNVVEGKEGARATRPPR